MDAEDFQALYKLVRGNRAAIAVTDARALFMEKKLDLALQKLLYAQETFVDSRSRVIKQDVEKEVDPKAKDADRQIKKLKRKQEKVLEAVSKFDEMVPVLQKLVRREAERMAKASPAEIPAAPAKVSAPAGVLVARPDDVTEEFVASFREADDQGQFDVIDEVFTFQEVSSESDIHGNALYYIRTGDSSYLVCTPEAGEMSESVELRSVIDDRPIKPFSRNAFLRLGTSRKMVLLIQRGSAIGIG